MYIPGLSLGMMVCIALYWQLHTVAACSLSFSGFSASSKITCTVIYFGDSPRRYGFIHRCDKFDTHHRDYSFYHIKLLIIEANDNDILYNDLCAISNHPQMKENLTHESIKKRTSRFDLVFSH